MSANTPLPPGKLPAALLGTLLARYVKSDPSVLVGPAIGRDAAAIEIGDRVLVVKTDPVTFATADAGWYLVNVNANDIVCMGANPRWLLVTALFPERTTSPKMVEDAFASLAQAADELGIALVGGHTEITLALDRLILVGQLLGEARAEELLDPRNIRPGDAVLLCSGIAVEGTAILATQARAYLGSLPDALLSRAERFLREPGISVLPAARALRESDVAIRAMHDPTEGGLATAVAELAAASGLGLELALDRVNVYPETQAICDALDLDPLGLIASGALLAVVAPEDVDRAIAATRAAGIPCARIGTMLDSSSASRVVQDGTCGPLPTFEVDELARFFARTEALSAEE
jgi:hydrogenase maturation factor